ncbi:MAG: ABC transporter ATP-binding protein [Actinobacteria bacterium]|nr:ABC transporter ATP-binding protein [Actinomycetota bacterium]
MRRLLKVPNIQVAYGKIVAVKDVSVTVNQGEIVTLIGSNGAGKSTTLRTISGLIKPKSGEILFNGKRIDGVPGHEIVGMGICHSPEGRRIFPRMTVKENLELGAFLRNNKSEVAADMERVLDLFPRLKERIKQTAGTMSGGEQQMLAVSRALMGDPKLLLLDEPSMGLAPVLVELIFDTIVKIRKQGITILLIEQNATAALEVADRAYVLESGKVKMSGSAKELSSDDKVTKAYLGH